MSERELTDDGDCEPTPMKRFPVLLGYGRERAEMLALGCPESVPWETVAPHEAQAWANHGQSLARLAERGGLSPLELMAVIGDRPWRDVRHMTSALAVAFLQRVGREPGWANAADEIGGES